MNQFPNKTSFQFCRGLGSSRPVPFLLAVAPGIMLFVTMLLASSPLKADTITEPPRLWVATSSAVHQFHPESPAFDLQLPGTQGTKALALDPGTRQLWLRTQEAMILVDSDGTYQMIWNLPSKGPGKSHLATLPSDDSIWIAEESSLESFGIGGQPHHQRLFPGKIQAIALDAPRNTLWVLTTAKLTGVQMTTGEELVQFRPQGLGKLEDLSVDRFSGDLWVGHGIAVITEFTVTIYGFRGNSNSRATNHLLKQLYDFGTRTGW